MKRICMVLLLTAILMGITIVNALETVVDHDSLSQEENQQAGHFIKAQEYFDSGKHEQAMDEYFKVIELKFASQLSADAYINIGVIFMQRKQFEGAVKSYASALMVLDKLKAKENAEIYAKRAGAYYMNGQNQEALADTDKAIQIDPMYANEASLIEIRAGCYYLLGKNNLAVNEYTKLIKLEPDSPFNYFARGSAYLALDQYEQARKDYDKALALNPDAGLRERILEKKKLFKKGESGI